MTVELGAAGGTGGNNLGLSGSADGGSACAQTAGALTPPVRLVLVATLTAATHPQAAMAASVLAELAVTAVSHSAVTAERRSSLLRTRKLFQHQCWNKQQC